MSRTDGWQDKVDSILSGDSLVNMDAPLNPDLQMKSDPDYDEWFLQEIEKGLVAADRGEFAEHAAVRKLMDDRYRGCRVVCLWRLCPWPFCCCPCCQCSFDTSASEAITPVGQLC